jgi:hypothetical protein
MKRTKFGIKLSNDEYYYEQIPLYLPSSPPPQRENKDDVKGKKRGESEKVDGVIIIDMGGGTTMACDEQLTKNFKLKEFTCRDGTSVPSEYLDNVQLLAENLQVLRDYVQEPIRVISGYRTKKYNTRINGARRSQHMLAKAGDIKIKSMKPREVHELILKLIREGKMMAGGVGIYRTFVHYDVRGYNARWTGKGVKDDKPSA